MKYFVLATVIVLYLTGCTSTHEGYYVNAPKNVMHIMSDDAALHLARMYAPARTELYLSQKSHDVFGQNFIASLRTKGFSLVEQTKSSYRPSINENATKPHSDVLRVGYLVDEPIQNKLYRVSLYVNQHVLSRAYKVANGTIKPLGFWVRKE